VLFATCTHTKTGPLEHTLTHTQQPFGCHTWSSVVLWLANEIIARAFASAGLLDYKPPSV